LLMISHKTTILVDRQLDLGAIGSLELRLEMCMGMGFPMGPGIPWDKTQNWEMGMGMGGNGKPPQWEWELPALLWEFIPKGFNMLR